MPHRYNPSACCSYSASLVNGEMGGKRGSLNMCRMLSKASPAASFKHVLALCSNSFVERWEGRNLTRKTVEAVKGFTEPPEAP